MRTEERIELGEIQLRELEEAIKAHPPATSGTYYNHRSVLEDRIAGIVRDEWPEFDQESKGVFSKYLTAASFIAAWYEVNGMNEKAEKAIAAYGAVASTIAGDEGSVLQLQEGVTHWVACGAQAWRSVMPAGSKGCFTALLIITGLSSLSFLLSGP